jgi:hypothetical protein
MEDGEKQTLACLLCFSWCPLQLTAPPSVTNLVVHHSIQRKPGMQFCTDILRQKIGFTVSAAVLCCLSAATTAQERADVFGPEYKNLETMSTGEWWNVKPNNRRTMNMNVERDQVVAFAVYTHDHGTLKLTAQLFPLKPDEAKTTTLEFRDNNGTWQQVA